jgi:adenylosuccinate lyase
LPYGYGLIALLSLEKGLEKLELNQEKIERDLEAHWAVLAEAIQTILRKENYPDPYNALKGLTRGKTAITRDDLMVFINELDLKEEVKEQLRQLRPDTYTGIFPPY